MLGYVCDSMMEFFASHDYIFLVVQIMSSQPIIAWNWSTDKQGLAVSAALDQTVRVYIVTKLNKH